MPHDIRAAAVLGKRMERLGLKVHPQHTQLLDFRPPLQGEGKTQTTFDFFKVLLVFGRTRNGRWSETWPTRRAARHVHDESVGPLRGERNMDSLRRLRSLGGRSPHFRFFG